MISETSKEFGMAGARSRERWETRGFGCSPGRIERIAVMESIEGSEGGTRQDMRCGQASLCMHRDEPEVRERGRLTVREI